MKQRKRRYFTAPEMAVIWDRWENGESLPVFFIMTPGRMFVRERLHVHDCRFGSKGHLGSLATQRLLSTTGRCSVSQAPRITKRYILAEFE
jgi:hypothetical protein